MRRSLSLLLPLSLLCGSCVTGFSPRHSPCQADHAPDGEAQLLAIGDSVFAWRMRTCQTVPDVAAIALGRTLEHRAVNGARLTGGDHAIASQYSRGPWKWVILDGGGNDLNNECDCAKNACDAVLDALVSEDGSRGELATLVDRIREDGARVALYGYYQIDERAYYGFDDCRDELDVLHARQQKLAAARDGVYFVDARQVVSPESTPDAYAFDHVHPAAEGAELVGALIARTIREAEAE